MNLRFWIEWNWESVFNSSGLELGASRDSIAYPTWTSSIMVPITAVLGMLGMRVGLKMLYSWGHTARTPCNIAADPGDWHGSIKDFYLNIKTTEEDKHILESSNISIFRNPFSSSTTIKVGSVVGSKELTLKILDHLGRSVKTISVTNSNEIQVQRDNLGAGIYFYQVFENQELLKVGKLVIVD